MKTIEELTTSLEQARTTEDSLERTSIITDIMTDLKETYETICDLQDSNNKLTEENLEYAKLNNKLALKVGESITLSNPTTPNYQEVPEKRTFENLLKNM